MSDAIQTGALPSSLAPAAPRVTDADVSLMTKVLGAAAQRPQQIPDQLMAYILDYVQSNNLTIPISQISGFTQFNPQINTVSATETTSATAFGDLSTVGPEFTALGPGQYLLIWGCLAKTSGASSQAQMGISVNGDSPATRFDAEQGALQLSSIMSAALVSLSSAANTVVAKYQCQHGDTGTFASRFLIAIRVANL